MRLKVTSDEKSRDACKVHGYDDEHALTSVGRVHNRLKWSSSVSGERRYFDVRLLF